MEMRYVVEVAGLGADPSDAARRLAQTFGVSHDKATRLLRRVPGVVTKPVSEQEALRVAALFEQAGLAAQLRPFDKLSTPPAEAVQAVSEPPVPVAPEPVARLAVESPPPPVPVPAEQPTQQAPVAVAPVAPVAKAPRLSIRTKFLLVGIVPVVLTITAAVAVILLILPGVLRTQLLEAARNPAIAFASSLPGSFEPAAIADLQVMLERSRDAFVAQGVSFVLVTDDAGHPRAGWVSGAASLEALAGEVYTGVRQRATGAMARAFAEQQGIAMGPVDLPSRLIDLAGTRIEVASHAVQRGDQVLGAVVIGIADEVVAARVTTLLLNTLALSLLPMLLAIVVAVALARSQTRNVLSLTKAAERMSRGDLESSVPIATNDELGELSRALERMRISLQESLERLRRPRR